MTTIAFVGLGAMGLPMAANLARRQFRVRGFDMRAGPLAALEARALLAKDKIDVGVLHVATIKPLDVATIVAEARRKSRPVVVAENHSCIGGLGEAVAGALMRENVRVPSFRQIALPDEFLDAGALPTLHDRYGISAEKIASSLKEWV